MFPIKKKINNKKRNIYGIWVRRKKKKPLNTLLISKTQQKNNKDSEKKIIPNNKSLFSQKVGLNN